MISSRLQSTQRVIFLMQLKLRNSLSGKIEVFQPINPDNIRMYVCGPTVYDRAHLGNARPAVVFDVLFRILKSLYKNVTYVRNITDVDDKIYKRAIEKNISIQELTSRTIEMYHNDIGALNVLPPDIEPKATEHISEMIKLIQNLIANGNAYESKGHVYFDVSTYSSYGDLSKKNIEDLQSGTRIDISEYKKNPLDFVLWKPIDDNFKMGWDSPWGVGRPGWHIECSAMSLKYLGEIFDIHGGGIDLIFPHHENEIAQSCAISGTKTMAKYWMHNGHLNIDGVKMSKSLGNFFTVHDILDKYDGEVIRLALLMAHYASPMNFTNSLLAQAKNTLDRWYNVIKNVQIDHNRTRISTSVFSALLEDLNTPRAISEMCETVDKINKTSDRELLNTFVYTARTFLGILYKKPDEWFCCVSDDTQKWIEQMIEKRAKAKKNKLYAEADAIRQELRNQGIVLEDTPSGTYWRTTM